MFASSSRIDARPVRSGFTLIEVIVVIILLGVLAAAAAVRFIDVADAARERAVDAAIAELNGRESLTWGLLMVREGGKVTDEMVFAAMDFDLGPDFAWDIAIVFPVGGMLPASVITNPLSDGSGGFLWSAGRGEAVPLKRERSTLTSPARWSRGDPLEGL